MEPAPLDVNLDGGNEDRAYVTINPANIQLTKNDKIRFIANSASGFSIVIDGIDGFFNPPQIWSKYIPAGGSQTTPEFSGSPANKIYSVFCIEKQDYHGAEKGPGGTDSPPKIIIIEE